eukprot:gene968-biopygen799
MNLLAAAPPGLHHSMITRRSPAARLPQTAAEWSALLHVTDIPRMWTTPQCSSTRKQSSCHRQEQLWELLEQFPPSPRDANWKGSVLPAADIAVTVPSPWYTPNASALQT